MQPSRRALLALPLAGALARPALAQAWPSRPIRIVIPFGVGGGTDVTTRILAPRLSEILGQTVVLENRGGAGGVIGTDYVAKQPPNGEVFVLATLSPIGLAPGLYARLPYDPLRDLVPIAPTVFVPICLATTTTGIDPRTAQDFIAMMKARPGAYQYGSSGVGSSGHLAAHNFAAQIGTEAVHVPFRGGGQVFEALLKGDIHYCCDIPSLLIAFHREGKVRILFTATDERSSLVPEAPTSAEIGLPGYKAYSWYGFFAPAGTSPAIVRRMAEATEIALSDATIARRFEEMGTPAMRGYTPERFADYVRQEVATWVPIVRASGARAE